jgi:hypothetical protein
MATDRLTVTVVATPLSPIETRLVERFREISARGYGRLTVVMQKGAVVNLEVSFTDDPQELRFIQTDAQKVTRGY